MRYAQAQQIIVILCILLQLNRMSVWVCETLNMVNSRVQNHFEMKTWNSKFQIQLYSLYLKWSDYKQLCKGELWTMIHLKYYGIFHADFMILEITDLLTKMTLALWKIPKKPADFVGSWLMVDMHNLLCI